MNVKNKIKVSVIVPVYNSEKYLIKCVESLINQTLDNIELIFINDGSTDESLRILNEYKKKYPLKINIITTRNNGIGSARNTGLKQAKGRYIFFVDSDDYIELNTLELMYNASIKNNADLVICNMNKVYEENETKEIIDICFSEGNLSNNKTQLIQIPLGPCGKLFLKENITTYFAEGLKYEDVPFVASAIRNSNNTIKVNESLYNYVIHSNSETTTMDKRVFDIFEILKITNKLFEKDLYINEELEYLNIQLLSRYNLQQKYQKDKCMSNEFLNKSFLFLNENFPNWKKNKYLKKRNILKRIIETNKILIRLYWKL